MKNLFYLVIALVLVSCGTSKVEKFTISGELKDAEDQKVFLEQLHFNQDPPVVLDSSELKDGKFELKTTSKEEGLYRIIFENHPGFLFINDKEDITLFANVKDSTLKPVVVSSPSTGSLYNLITTIDSIHTKLMLDDQARQLYLQSGNDSMASVVSKGFEETQKQLSELTLKYADTAKSPVVSLFGFSYAMDTDQDGAIALLESIKKKWPANGAVKEVAQQMELFTQAQQQSQQGMPRQGLEVGTKAPEITMNDTEGKPFSLSSLRGKYVLVDFWAGWCGPCRMENPNVVNAYNKFKDKNFTVLGVSLDQTKEEWLKAINDDKLEWKQISDLKFWESAAVPLYRIQGIPYNVLVDPEGTIIASELRGPALEKKLAEVLN